MWQFSGDDDVIAGQPAAVQTAPAHVAVAADDVTVVDMLTWGNSYEQMNASAQGNQRTTRR